MSHVIPGKYYLPRPKFPLYFKKFILKILKLFLAVLSRTWPFSFSRGWNSKLDKQQTLPPLPTFFIKEWHTLTPNRRRRTVKLGLSHLTWGTAIQQKNSCLNERKFQWSNRTRFSETSRAHGYGNNLARLRAWNEKYNWKQNFRKYRNFHF